MTRLAYVLPFFVVTLASVAHADDAPTAAQLKQRGDAAMQALHYRDALEAYEQAYALGHDPAILYNRARAEQALGDYPAALEAIEEFVHAAPDDLKQRVPHLAEMVADFESRVALVVVNCAINDATVRIGGRVVGKTPLPAAVRVAAGEIAIAVEAPNHTTFHQDVNAPGGKVTTINATLASNVVEVTQPVVVPPPVVRTETYVSSGWRIAAFSIGGVGVAGLVLGGISGGLVASKTSDANAHCPSKACDPFGWAAINDAKTFATISTVSFIAGSALVAGAVILYVVAPHATRKMGFAPIVGPSFIGIGGVL